MRLLGYTPSANAYNAPQLTLTLAELKYQSPKDGVYVTQADITATFRADVQNSSRRYTGRYGASLNQRFGMAPNQATNSKLVSEVLSDALTACSRTRPSLRLSASNEPVTRKPGGWAFSCARETRRPGGTGPARRC